MDLAAVVTQHILEAKFEDMSHAVVEATKAVILDQLAIALSGSAADGAVQVAEEVLDWAGKPESTVWVYGNKVPVANAAFANSVMTHGWDHDDAHLPSITHTGTVTVPAAFATAERRGKLNGKQLITAVNIGIEVVTRLSAGVPTSFEQGWHPTTVFGGFGTAATAGWILELNETQMRNALGLTYSRTSGNIQCVPDGALSKRLQPGFASKAALEAVLLAEKGVTGATNIFEGQYGLYPLYFKNKCSRNVVISEWGKLFASPYLTIKPYPG
jgi:2-methylcitrate dehydratase PrpD